MSRRAYGFTIVELLIVVVVIAILAAVSVVAYRGIQNRAYNTSVQSDLKSIATKIELYKAEQGVYPVSTSAMFATLGLSATKSAYDTTRGIHGSLVYNLLYCKTADSSQFALVARAKSGDTFQFSRGSVTPYTAPLFSNLTEDLCSGAGITTVSGNWVWLYNLNAWQTWVGS